MKPNMKLINGFNALKIPTVRELIDLELCKFFFKLTNDLLPISLRAV